MTVRDLDGHLNTGPDGDEPIIEPDLETPVPLRSHQRVTDALTARYGFPDDERLVTTKLNNGIVVRTPVLVEAQHPDHPTMRIRFEAEEGKLVITNFELVRTAGGAPINAAAVRDLPLAPIFKAVRARLVTAFSIIEQLGGRALLASEPSPRPDPFEQQRAPVREEAPSTVTDPGFATAGEAIPRPITRPPGRHLARRGDEPAEREGPFFAGGA